MLAGGIFEGKDATKRYLDGLGVSKHEALDVERVVDLGDRVLGITTVRAKPPGCRSMGCGGCPKTGCDRVRRVQPAGIGRKIQLSPIKAMISPSQTLRGVVLSAISASGEALEAAGLRSSK